MSRAVPKYRRKIVRGKSLAYVTLSDSLTRDRKDYSLGVYASPESRKKYAMLVAAWESAGRRLQIEASGDLRLTELFAAHLRWAKEYHCKTEYCLIFDACNVAESFYGLEPVSKFGPRQLRIVRDAMIAKDWSRKFINRMCGRLCAVFRWGHSHDMASLDAYQSLKTVESLRRGKCKARENEPIRPVSIEDIEAVKPYVSRQVWAIIQLQLATGARAGELIGLRKCDIDRTEDVWKFSPGVHKTAHHGRTRTIYFGPKAKEIITPFLLRPDGSTLFSPADAEAERRKRATHRRITPKSCGNRRGTNVVDDPSRSPGESYTTASYRRAISRACDQVNAWRKGGLVVDNKERVFNSWHPHQLRHTAATQIRRRFGLEAAQIILGHSSAAITDAIYAERDETKALDVARQIG